MAKNIQSSAEFEQLIRESHTPVVVDFWAPWCGPCKALSPILDSVDATVRSTAQIVKVNIDDHQELALAHGITSIPTLLFFNQGSLQHRQTGIALQEDIITRINALASTVI
ncbi:MAG: thioredoxin [Lentimonas sp.]|jgi:thioredoxin